MDRPFESHALEIDLTAPPSADVAALAAIVADMGRWACDLEERLSAVEKFLGCAEPELELNRLADCKLEVFYLPELAESDPGELRDRVQEVLEEALPGLAARLRDEGLLLMSSTNGSGPPG